MLNKFDLCKSPLAGRWLLEASAGTGKTYSLEHLVLRLLVEENVAVNRVLLVTFTNAATNEIKERVGALLRRMLARVENPEKGRFRTRLRKRSSPAGTRAARSLRTFSRRRLRILRTLRF